MRHCNMRMRMRCNLKLYMCTVHKAWMYVFVLLHLLLNQTLRVVSTAQGLHCTAVNVCRVWHKTQLACTQMPAFQPYRAVLTTLCSRLRLQLTVWTAMQCCCQQSALSWHQSQQPSQTASQTPRCMTPPGLLQRAPKAGLAQQPGIEEHSSAEVRPARESTTPEISGRHQYPASFTAQLRALLWRQSVRNIRNPTEAGAKLIAAVVIAVLIGIIFLDLPTGSAIVNG